MEIETAGAGSGGEARRHLETLSRRRWYVIGPVILGLLAAVYVGRGSEGTFTTTARVSAADPSQSSVFNEGESANASDTDRLIASAIQLIRGTEVEKIVCGCPERYPDNDAQTPSAIAAEDEVEGLGGATFDQITLFEVAPVSDTLFIDIAVGSLDPEIAQVAAQTFAEAYVQEQGRLDIQILRTRALELRKSAALLDGDGVELLDPRELQELVHPGGQVGLIDDGLQAIDQQLVELSFEIRVLDDFLSENGTVPPTLVDKTIQETNLRRQREIELGNRTRRSEEAQFFRQEANRIDIETSFRLETGANIVSNADPASLIAGRSLRRDLVVYGMLGAMVGVALALAREYFDSRIKSVADLQDLAPTLPIVGAIPRMGGLINQPHLAVSSGRPWYAAEAYRSLRTTILAMHGRHKRSFVFSSVGASAGKSVTVTNLAVSLANAGFNTLVIDANLRRPSVHMKLGVANHTGVAQLLADAGDPADFVRFSHLAQGLDVLPAGVVPANPSELVGSQRMTQLIEWAEMRYDFVLIDSPPLDVFTDAAVVAHHLGGVFLVVRFGATEQPRLLEALDQLATSGVPVLGLVVNGRDPNQSRAIRYARRIGMRNLKTLWTDRPSVRAPAAEASSQPEHAATRPEPTAEDGEPLRPRVPGRAAGEPTPTDASHFAPAGDEQDPAAADAKREMDAVDLLVRERVVSAQDLASGPPSSPPGKNGDDRDADTGDPAEDTGQGPEAG